MDLITLLSRVLFFLNDVVIPFIIVLAFLFFIVNAARYFIIQGGEEEARKKAKSLALWGIIAFVLILSIWGIVNVLTSGFFINRSDPITPDFVESRGGSGLTAPNADCSGSFLGFRFCSTERGGGFQFNPGSPPQETIDPNPQPRTIRVDF